MQRKRMNRRREGKRERKGGIKMGRGGGSAGTGQRRRLQETESRDIHRKSKAASKERDIQTLDSNFPKGMRSNLSAPPHPRF